MSYLDKFSERRVLDRWTRAAATAETAELPVLRHQVDAARALKAVLDDHLHVAENRLQLPRVGSNSFFRASDADWSWRPDVFRGPLPTRGISGVETRMSLGGEATLFHDSRLCEITLSQLRNMREEDLAPYGLRLEVFRFEGSFLSVVLDLPPDAARGLKKNHLVRLDAIIEIEHPIEIYARLNVQHGPNCEQIVRNLPLDSADVMLEFDLAYTDFNDKRAERLWLDLIFDNPEMNQITVRDMTFSRSPRAEM